MMGLSRRDILKILATSAAGMGLSGGKWEALAASLSDDTPASPLIWVGDVHHHLNHLALLGEQAPSFLKLITLIWNVWRYPPSLPTGYHLPERRFVSAPILVLESLPEPAEGQDDEGFKGLVSQAKVVILLGTEVCFGSMSTPAGAIARFEGLCKAEKTALIKLPGIPVPPHHLLGVLSHLETFGFPRLDGWRRPLLYYGRSVCEDCEHQGALALGQFVEKFGERGCLLRLGCKGPITHNSCSVERWNGGVNWCVGAGGPCTGCSEPGFPDHGGLGLYGALQGVPLKGHSSLLQNIEAIGLGLAALAAGGIALRMARHALRASWGGAPEEEEG